MSKANGNKNEFASLPLNADDVARSLRPLEAASMLPPAAFVDQEVFDWEMKNLFLGGWICLGHISQVAEQGRFIRREMGPDSIVVVGGEHGQPHAFLNVCRHRGTRVVEEARGGGRRSFACPYHGWTYGLDGALAAIPHAAGFPGVRESTGGLVELPCAERFGFLWVRPSPGEPLDVDAYLGPIARDFAGFGWEEHVSHAAQEWRRAYNWKVGIDISLETYHIRRTHADTIARLFFDNVGVFDRFGPHLRNLFPKRSVVECREIPRVRWNIREHANVLYALFPNTVMLVQPDHLSVLHLYPDGTDACRVQTYTVVPTPPDERAARYWDANNAIFHGALAEDFHMGETAQRGFRSGANEALTFGRFEHSLAWFHEAVDAALAGAALSGTAPEREIANRTHAAGAS
ncbi:MAG: Rieske 2Fe-2S domain-containing protein [Myxococcales bacterium]|nr:Rieske 2Fe-2S domain-containing protein [Myxococcales bacterium]